MFLAKAKLDLCCDSIYRPATGEDIFRALIGWVPNFVLQ